MCSYPADIGMVFMNPVNPDQVQFPLEIYVCTKIHCTRRRKVSLKVREGETPREVNGPALLQILQEIVTKKGYTDRVLIHDSSCTGGCPLGPRVNIEWGKRPKDMTMYLKLRAPRANPQLVGWREISSLETLIESYLHPQETLVSSTRPVPDE